MSEKSIKAVCTSNVYNHWGMTDDPKELTVGKEYTVDYVVIHGSYTQTILVGDPEHAQGRQGNRHRGLFPSQAWHPRVLI